MTTSTKSNNRIKLAAYFIALFVFISYSDGDKIHYQGNNNEGTDQYTANDVFRVPESRTQVDDKRECKTKACVDLDKRMRSKMDTRSSPCADMYQYACGKFSSKQSSGSTFGRMHNHEIKALRKILDGLKNKKSPDIYTKVYNWYSACMNIKQINKLGTRPMLELLGSLGSWPVLNHDWSKGEWDLEKTLAMIHRNISLFPLFKISVTNNATDVSNSLYRLVIEKTNLPLEIPEFYLKSSKYSNRMIFAYFELLTNLAELLGAKNRIQVMFDVLHVIQFQIELAEAMKLEGEYLVSPYTTLGSLRNSNEGKVFDWKRYISYLYQDLPKQQPFKDSEVIYIREPKYFKRMLLLIAKTQPRVIANYMLAKVVFRYSGDLSEKLRRPYHKFYRAAYGIKTISPLWMRCVKSTSYHINSAVTALYVEKYLPDKDLKKAKELVHMLVDAYLKHLQNIEWMDTKTKQAAEDKVRAMIEHVGYPKDIRNITVLEEGYKEVEVNPLTYFENVRKNYQVWRKSTLNLRGTKPNRKSWAMSYTVQNAQYSPSSNKIGVSAGLLQPPLFHSDYPSAINFGSIGMATGHEMTHGFDATGAMFDKEGNVKLWWTNDTLNTFKEKRKCMIKQYSRFLVYGHHLNGKKTLNENIADNGGMRIAYEAYSQWLKSKGPDSSLPTLDLTPKQQFFLSFSQTWCSKTTMRSAIYSLYTDQHSPNKARVNYVLSNIKEFSDAFQCEKGSPMNPHKKCIVW